METQDLPLLSECNIIVHSADYEKIEWAVRALLDEHSFSHLDVIAGASKSGRILLTKPSASSINLSPKFTPTRFADALEKLVAEARYDPEPARRTVKTKGWAIYETVFDGAPAIICFAAWVVSKGLY